MPIPKITDQDLTFFRGSRSDTDPAQLAPGYVWNMVNMVNRGGVLKTRPGHICRTSLPDGKLQGAELFRPKIGIEVMVVVISGIVYVAPWPFFTFRMLDNVLLSSHVERVYFCLAEQSVERVDHTLESAIEFILPRNVLFIQDGGYSPPAWFDGSGSGHVRENPYETPAGGPMCWVGDRLWVATGSRVWASDIANPFSYREQEYLGGASSLVFPEPVTALAKTPGLEFPELLVGCENASHLVMAHVRNREAWALTDGFQRELFPIGITSQRSVVSQFGKLWWFSPSGLTSFDAAALSKQTGRQPVRDIEMAVSKAGLADNLGGVAGATFGNYLLMSVPSGDSFNSHTWVMDGASVESLQDSSGPSWGGYWTGTRPVQWVYGTVAGRERIFHVSVDVDGKNRLWESFTDSRSDNGCPITWHVESRGYFGALSGVNFPSGRQKTLCFAQVQLAEISEKLDVAVFWAGANRGPYKRCSTKRVNVERGNIRWDVPITQDTLLFGLKPQSRVITTEDVRKKSPDENTSCAVEGDREENDTAFQFCIVGSGEAAIEWIRVFAEPVTANDIQSGVCEKDETEANLVRFDGAASEAATYAEAVEALTAGSPYFESTQTVVISRDGLTVSGSGWARSVISQADADKIATRIAERQAEVQYEREAPTILSDGKSFNPDEL